MAKMKYIIIILCILLTILPDVGSLEIKGTYHTWWITLPLPVPLVQQMLPDGASLIPDIEFPLPPNTHPILLELGREINCGPTIFKFLQMNFMEAKFDIPFLSLPGRSGTYTQKQSVFVNTTVQSIGAALSYKLNARKADVTMTQSQYLIGYNGSRLVMNQSDVRMTESEDPIGYNGSRLVMNQSDDRVKQSQDPIGARQNQSDDRMTKLKNLIGGSRQEMNQSDSSDWVSVKDLPNFSFYESMLNQTWFGRDTNVCGKHTYNFSTGRVRPIRGRLQVDGGVFNDHFPTSPFVVEGLDQSPFGAVEAILDFTISDPQKC